LKCRPDEKGIKTPICQPLWLSASLKCRPDEKGIKTNHITVFFLALFQFEM
jgi:hypothetical protein